jgi:hypothetical protein
MTMDMVCFILFLFHDLSLDFQTRILRYVPLIEQEPFTIPEHLSTLPVFSGVHGAKILDFSSFFFGALHRLCSVLRLLIHTNLGKRT